MPARKPGMATAILSKMDEPKSAPSDAPTETSEMMRVALRRAYTAVKQDKPDEFASAIRAAIRIGQAEEDLG